MVDATLSSVSLESEHARIKTFTLKDKLGNVSPQKLAHAGFYYDTACKEIKCYKCKNKINLNSELLKNFDSLNQMHEEQCDYAKKSHTRVNNTSIRKTFVTLESLRYEDERLHTFIDWPVKFIQPKDLASNGFYYLREKDHVACIFCRGVVGSWEEGDTPADEHKKHFSNCAFIRGQPVGNVPSRLGKILNRLPVEENISSVARGIDVCGPGSLESK